MIDIEFQQLRSQKRHNSLQLIGDELLTVYRVMVEELHTKFGYSHPAAA